MAIRALLPLSYLRGRYGGEEALLLFLLRRRFGCVEGADGFDPWALRVDPGRMVELLKRHGAAGLLQQDALLLDLLGDAGRERLHRYLGERARLNLALLEETVLLSGRMRSEGVRTVFPKGVLLGLSLYGDLSTRHSRDVDLLVDPAAFAGLRAIFSGMGYREYPPFPEAHADYYMGFNKEQVFGKAGLGMPPACIDVQWAPGIPDLGVGVDNGFFLSEADVFLHAGVEVPVPEPGRHFLFLLVHHGLSELWDGLQHVCDLAAFRQRHGDAIDWEGLALTARRWGLYRNAATGFALCHALLGCAPPAAFSGRARGDLLPVLTDRIFRGVPGDRYAPSRLALRLRLADGWRPRMRQLSVLARKAFSPGLHDLRSIPLPGWAFALYYPIKPLRMLLHRVFGFGRKGRRD